MLPGNTWVSMEENEKSRINIDPESTSDHFAIFINDRTIMIICKNKKVVLPVVQNNMIIQGPEIPY